MANSVVDSFYKGYSIGDVMRQRKREKQLNDILSNSYTAPQTVQVPNDELGVLQETKPGGFNYSNALAAMYKGGFGKEAMALEQQQEQNELAKLFKAAQIQKMTRPTLGEPKAGLLDGREIYFRTDDRGNVYDISGQPISGSIQPRPQQPLVQIGDKADQAAAVELAKEDTKRLTKADEDAALARTSIGGMERMREILQSPSMRTGTLAGTETAVSRGVKSLTGVDPKQIGMIDPALADEFTALGNQAVLVGRRVMQMPASGFSDADREFLQKANPGLGLSKEANERLIKLGYMSAQYLAERHRMMDEMFRSQRNLKGFESKFADYWSKRKKELEKEFGGSTGNLQPGKTIEGGYIYLGGDPSKPESWKKLQ